MQAVSKLLFAAKVSGCQSRPDFITTCISRRNGSVTGVRIIRNLFVDFSRHLRTTCACEAKLVVKHFFLSSFLSFLMSKLIFCEIERRIKSVMEKTKTMFMCFVQLFGLLSTFPLQIHLTLKDSFGEGGCIFQGKSINESHCKPHFRVFTLVLYLRRLGLTPSSLDKAPRMEDYFIAIKTISETGESEIKRSAPK